MTGEASAETINYLVMAVRQVMIEHAFRDRAEVEALRLGPETVISDVGIDSFDFIELIFKVEDHFDIKIDHNANNTINEIKSVADFARVVDELLFKKAS